MVKLILQFILIIERIVNGFIDAKLKGDIADAITKSKDTKNTEDLERLFNPDRKP